MAAVIAMLALMGARPAVAAASRGEDPAFLARCDEATPLLLIRD